MTPFREKSETLIFEKILNQEELHFSNRTPSVAQDLILKLLDKTPSKRIGFENFEDLKSHPFFKGIAFEKISEMLPPDESIIQIHTCPLKLKKSISCAKLDVLNQNKLDMKIDEEIEKEEIVNSNDNDLISSTTKNKKSSDKISHKFSNKSNKNLKKIEDNEHIGLAPTDDYKSSNKEKEPIQHKNTISTSYSKNADYEQIKYNMRKSTLKQMKNQGKGRSTKKYNSKNHEALVLECKF